MINTLSYSSLLSIGMDIKITEQSDKNTEKELCDCPGELGRASTEGHTWAAMITERDFLCGKSEVNGFNW